MTGASGLVGSAVRRRWARAGFESVFLGRRERPGWWHGDLLDEESLRGLPWKRVRGVVHCASLLPWDPGDVARANATMTRNLLSALREAPVEHFVLVSSVSVYPMPRGAVRVVLDESGPAAPPEAVYGASKWEQERRVEQAAIERGLGACVLRLSSVYGPGQREQGALPVFWGQATRNEEIAVTAPRDYVQNYVAADDVAEIVWQAHERRLAGRFNVFSEETVDMWTLAQRIQRVAGGGRLVDRRTDQVCPEVVYSRTALEGAMDHRFLTLEQGLERLR